MRENQVDKVDKVNQVNQANQANQEIRDPLVKKSGLAVASGRMDSAMDALYVAGNAYNSISSIIKPLLASAPVVGVAWNLFDALGSLVVAAHNKEEEEWYAAKMNAVASLQVAALTSVSTASLCLPHMAALSLAGSVCGPFSFAIAMAISWRVESKAVQDCDNLLKDQIDSLNDNTLSEGDVVSDEQQRDVVSPDRETLIQKVTNAYEQWKDSVEMNDTDRTHNRDNLMEALDTAMTSDNMQVNDKNQLQILKNTLIKRVQHNRARRVWKVCTMAMTCVAVVATLGATGVSMGLVPVIATGVLAVISGCYRLYQKNKKVKGRGAKRPRSFTPQKNEERQNNPSNFLSFSGEYSAFPAPA